ncbi:MAG TPA: TraR/DksA C4-type zinc finger protein [Candidatus Hydrogenedentes bacterium]|mgnify:CR=1 FL=1|nr:TraR/DksA C4-type zinc finger protein [Candidatus Hydrogenedentota bacterium]
MAPDRSKTERKASKLTKTELKMFEKMLLEEREKLLRTLRGLYEETRSADQEGLGGEGDDGLDQHSDSFGIETSLNLMGREATRLREIEDALDRIRKGTYGICMGSGKPIPIERLKVMPTARYTREYQEQLEKEQRGFQY